MDIGERLKRFREAKGLKQGEVAERAAWGQHEIVRVEAAVDLPVSKLQRALKGLGMTLADFFESRVPDRYANPTHQDLHEQFQEILEVGGKEAEWLAGNVKVFYDQIATKKRKRVRTRPKDAATESPPQQEEPKAHRRRTGT